VPATPPDGEQFLTVGELIDSARRSLEPELWDYAAGGSDGEQTLRENRLALERISFRGRILRDVHDASAATTFLGIPLALPVMLAPVGTVALFDVDGAVSVAQAAADAGTVGFIGVLSRPALDEVAKACPDAAIVFQLYARGDRDWLASLVRRAEDAGCRALCLTADSAVEARRERDLRNRLDFRVRHGPLANLEALGNDRSFQSRITWSDLEWLRSATTLPLVLKGVLCGEDATLAIEAGVDAVYVSNHGGRTLDGAPGAIDVLEEVVDAVAGRAEVVVDGGFLRGVDVLKALASGARAAGIGKLQCWGLAAGGRAGLARVLELLRLEIETGMALLGVRGVAELNPGLLRRRAV
jgi:isopentenyl diphosphate isomerase/L-lactate dehydrogenase-like FMN-dependent dehydrogenase